MSDGTFLVSQSFLDGEPEHAEMIDDIFSQKLGVDLPAKPRTVSPFRYGKGMRRRATQVQSDRFNRTLFIPPVDASRVWESLTEYHLQPPVAYRNLLVSARPTPASAATFDILRTRILQALEENGWTRIAITAPTPGCGITFTAANLALSLARKASCRTLLFDMNLRSPGLARAFGVSKAGRLRDLLSGEQPIESHVLRIGQNLALALNDETLDDPAELLHDPDILATIETVEDALRPDVTLFDLPATLNSDDTIAMLPEVDAVLLVVDGTKTTAAHVRACERLFEGKAPLLGVVLNQAEDRGLFRDVYRNRG